MTRVNVTPKPPYRHKDWPQPQTVVSPNPAPIQHFPRGPIT